MPRPIPCFPWICLSASSSMRATRKALSSDGQSKSMSKSTPPAMIIGSFKLINGKVNIITTDENTPFKLAINASAKRALKASSTATGINQTPSYGLALVTWKKGQGRYAKVTGYFPFADPENLAERLSKQRALAVYDRWMYGG